MTQFLIITGVFAGLAMLAEIVYTACRIAYENHRAKMEKHVKVIPCWYIGIATHESEDGFEDVFDLGVTDDEINVVKFGDEE